MLPAHFQIPAQPHASPEAIVQTSHARFTILTPRLIRMEYSPSGEFEDRASQAFWYRCQPTPAFTVKRENGKLEILTEYLRLKYEDTPSGFTPETLSIDLLTLGITWHYGDRDWQNLRGTCRTLDEAKGPVHLEQGLMSRSGWAVVDDSRSLVFNDQSWLEPRRHPENLDLYFFGYGHDYAGCLADFCKVAGQTPLIPRWILGNWWSRYWEYSESELKELMLEFQRREVPLSVCIIDMDWHITRTGNRSTGWTGYTWNRELFPDPEGLIAWLHQQGLRTALNLHPAEGIHPHEAQYEAMARAMGIDPASRQPVPFDIADPQFTRAYFEILHHPMEAQGIDFWWMDWQQGSLSKLKDLDPLWWLNHLHFLDLGRDGIKRPFVFSRWGGLGNHRYPIGFSGDTVVSWESLQFQPYFTATAANVGYGWWSHDIGGHMRGEEDPELYTRWVQFGVFSPILRLHSTKNPYHDRIPWAYDEEVFQVARRAFQLRHALIPYIYSMAWRNHTQSLPLITPMYYSHPEDLDAYLARQQYWFGSELIAAPFTSPAEADTRLSKQPVWLPEGDWFDFFTGEHYPGRGWRTFYGTLREIPVFAKAGAIVPMAPLSGKNETGVPAEFTLYLFPGANNRFELYEDDGQTNAYLKGVYCQTPFTLEWAAERLVFSIEPAQGEVSLVPSTRVYRLVLRGISEPGDVKLEIDGRSQPARGQYDPETETWSLEPVSLAPTGRLVLAITANQGTLMGNRDRRIEKIRRWLHRFRLETGAKHALSNELPNLLKDPSRLAAFPLTGAQMNTIRSSLLS